MIYCNCIIKNIGMFLFLCFVLIVANISRFSGMNEDIDFSPATKQTHQGMRDNNNDKTTTTTATTTSMTITTATTTTTTQYRQQQRQQQQ